MCVCVCVRWGGGGGCGGEVTFKTDFFFGGVYKNSRYFCGVLYNSALEPPVALIVVFI